MFKVRHTCNARLFDTTYPVQLGGNDIRVKCRRCSRVQKKDVIAGYNLEALKWQEPIKPDAIYCQNLKCLARVCDIALPYTLVQENGDLEISCPKCKDITRIKLGRIANVV